jgi:site-specific DNA recombinase
MGKKAFKESHTDEIAFHQSALTELQAQQSQIKQRIDRLYDDKLDGKITQAFYNQKFAQFSTDLTSVETQLSRHNSANTNYYQLGMNLYDLSQRAEEAFQKGTVEQKRQLIQLVFNSLQIDNGKIVPEYSEPFLLLTKAIQPLKSSKVMENPERTDKTFEPDKNALLSFQKDVLYAFSPVVLPREDSNLQPYPYRTPLVTKRSGLSHPHNY